MLNKDGSKYSHQNVKMDVFQKASFINFEEYGMATKNEIQHN